MAAALTDFAALDAHMLMNSYVEGYEPTQKDMSIFAAISKPDAKFPNALRWWKHISAISEAKAASLPGTFEKLAVAAPSTASTSAAAPTPTKAEKKAEKKGQNKTEEKKEKKPEISPEEQAAKDKEKLIKKVIKEGGKKGVEIEGASDMGGLEFFCTTIESPEGDVELLGMAMTAMNAIADPNNDEERKGCSGHVGKMIFSAGVKQLAMVAFVPQAKVDKVDIKEWIAHVAGAVKGDIIGEPTKADAPDNDGLVYSAVVTADPDKGKFPIKDKDTAMAAAFAFLREKGAFPEDNDDDDDDECAFGDDAFDELGF